MPTAVSVHRWCLIVASLAFSCCAAFVAASSLPSAQSNQGLGWWQFRGDSVCAGEFEQCPATGDCVLVSSMCGQCPHGHYLCPPTSSSSKPECHLDFADCSNLKGTFWDYTLPVDVRVAMLVNLTTVDEQIQQLQNQAPGIPRLYIPRYQWLNDDLHGLRGNWTTSFPNGNALGATFARDTLRNVGRIIALEARGVHHFYTSRGRRGEGWVNGIGLTAYAPNINLVRDPRWGRAQEVYGEDPFLTGSLSEMYVTGMQTAGDTPYLSAAACCKHFAAYDVENFPTARYFYNAIVNGRDLFESYLPAFESCAGRAKAAHVMCSYNAINGVPTCAEPRLLNDVLRGRWNFSGFVVSDYDAWAQIYQTHKYCPNMTCAAATGLNAGMDQEGGGDAAIDALPAALAAGLVTKERIAQAFSRLFATRIRLGMFDPPSMVRLSNLSATVVSSTRHVEAALDAARDAIGLYVNNNNALPLDEKKKPKIALIGPTTTSTRWLQGNYATPPVNGIVSIAEAMMNVRCPFNPTAPSPSQVLYATDLSSGSPVAYPSVPATSLDACRALCHADVACNYVTFYETTQSCVKLPTDIYVQAGLNQSVQSAPRHGLVINNYDTSMQISSDLTVPAEDARQCGQRCRNSKLCRTWTFNPTLGTCALIDDERRSAQYVRGMVSGMSPSKCVENITLVDACSDGLACNVPFGFSEAVRQASEADAVVVVFGLDQDMESEGSDRHSIELPANQYLLLQLLRDTLTSVGSGAPLIGVMVHGGTVALNITLFDGLLDAWYPGMQGGQAIADVIFGRVNPAGRAAVTYYASDAELPPNLAQQSFYPNATSGYKGLTYRYYTGAPVIPFGFGLSYTSFEYVSMNLSATSITACEPITATIVVKNTGKVAGDEVVQVYVTQQSPAMPAPQVRLVGFSRVRNISPGQSKTVSITIDARFRSVVQPNADDIYASIETIEAGVVTVSAAGGQPAYYDGTVLTQDVTVTSTAPVSSC